MKAFQKGKTRSSSLAWVFFRYRSSREGERSAWGLRAGHIRTRTLVCFQFATFHRRSWRWNSHTFVWSALTSSYSSSSLVGGLSDCCPPAHTNTCVHTNHLDLHFFLFSPHAGALSCKKVLLLSLLDIKIEIVDYFFFVRVSNNLVYTTPDLYVTFTFSNLFNLSPQVRKSFSTTTFNFKLGIQCAIFVYFCINVTNAFLCTSKPSMSVFFCFVFMLFFCKHGCPHSTPNCSRRTGKRNCIGGVRKPLG